MRRQSIETAPSQLLYVGSLDSVTGTFVMPFRFANAGPRVMLTLKMLAMQRFASPPYDWTIGGTISWFMWACRVIVTGDGQRVPVQNLLGTRAAPVRLDSGASNDSVNGASIDWTGGGDGVDGEITMVVSLVSSALQPTLVSLRGRYNAVAPLCDDEWAAIAARVSGYPDAKFQGKIGTSLG